MSPPIAVVAGPSPTMSQNVVIASVATPSSSEPKEGVSRSVPSSPIEEDPSSSNTASSNSHLAPFTPSCLDAIQHAIKLFDIRSNDTIYDLGAGDGRFLFEVAKSYPDNECIGIDIDQDLVDRARKNRRTKYPHLTNAEFFTGNLVSWGESPNDLEFFQQRAYKRLVDSATIIYVFLVPKGLRKIKPLLEVIVEKRKKEERGLKVVAYMFRVPDWQPARVDRCSKGGAPLYLYTF